MTLACIDCKYSAFDCPAQMTRIKETKKKRGADQGRKTLIKNLQEFSQEHGKKCKTTEEFIDKMCREGQR